MIEKRICLDAKYLDNNIYKHLFDKIILMTRDECSLDHGYILVVDKIEKIIDNYISPGTSDIVFIVLFSATVLKPTTGTCIEGKVIKIFEAGIRVLVADKMKVLILASELEGYTMNDNKTSYICGDTEISDGDIVDIEITGLKYRSDKRDYICFGKLL